jgi:hypothetical protein
VLDGTVWQMDGASRLVVAAVALLGAVTLWLAWRRLSAAGTARDRTITSVVYALLTAIFALLLFERGIPHVGSQLDATPGLTSLGFALAAFGGSLLVLRRRTLRTGGVIAVVGSIAAVVLGSGAASSLATTTPMAWTSTSARMVTATALPENAMSLRLSPSAKRFAAQLSDADVDDESPIVLSTFVLGDVAGDQRRVVGQDLGFLDDDHVVVLGGSRQALRVRMMRVTGDTAPMWETPLPPMIAPALFVDRHTREWTVAGFLPGADTLLVMSGGVASDAARTTKLGNAGGIGQVARARADGSAIVSSMEVTRSPLAMLSLLGGPGFSVRLRDLRGVARRDLAHLGGFLSCGSTDRSGATLCTTVDRTRTRVWRLSARSELSVVGVLPAGSYRPSRADGSGLALLTGLGGDVLVLPAGASSGMRIHLADPGSAVYDAAVVPGFLGAVVYGPHGTELRIYALPEAPTPTMASVPPRVP